MILVNGAFIDRYRVFVELIVYPPILEALARLGTRLHPGSRLVLD